MMEVGGGASSAVGVTDGVPITGKGVAAALQAVKIRTSRIHKKMGFIIVLSDA
jgi:hypothetical protein